MMSVREYISLILVKKKWSRKKLTEELNKIEEKLGDRKSCLQNVTNYLNGYCEFGPKILVKYEKALDLPLGTLTSMVAEPITSESKREFKEIVRKVKEI